MDGFPKPATGVETLSEASLEVAAFLGAAVRLGMSWLIANGGVLVLPETDSAGPRNAEGQLERRR
jgi:hypothetical protein